jgi:hypothetical protein
LDLVVLVGLSRQTHPRRDSALTAAELALTFSVFFLVFKKIVEIGWNEEEIWIVDIVEIPVTSSAECDCVMWMSFI